MSDYSATSQRPKGSTVTIRSVAQRGRVLSSDLKLDDGPIENQERRAKRACVESSGEVILTMRGFPVLSYEDDGPVGSYLTLRHVNNLVLVGDFVLFVQRNTGVETFTNWTQKYAGSNWCFSEPQTTEDFRNHAVYLIPDSLRRLDYARLASYPRLYFGREPNLPVGVQLFPTRESYSDALTTLVQSAVNPTSPYRLVSANTLECGPVDVAEIGGAARVFVDGHGWRFLLPNSGGALAALDVLRATGNADDWAWLSSHVERLSDFQRRLLVDHFAATPLADVVRERCA